MIEPRSVPRRMEGSALDSRIKTKKNRNEGDLPKTKAQKSGSNGRGKTLCTRGKEGGVTQRGGRTRKLGPRSKAGEGTL